MGELTSGNETGDVGHVGEKVRLVLVSNGPHAGVVVVASVRGGTSHNELGPEQSCILLQPVVVNDACLLVETVRHRLRSERNKLSTYTPCTRRTAPGEGD